MCFISQIGPLALMRAIISREQSLHGPVNLRVPRWHQGHPLLHSLLLPTPPCSPCVWSQLHAAAVHNWLGNSMYLATQMSDAGSCPKGRRTRTVNKDLSVLYFGAPAVSFTLFTLNYSGSALSNCIWSTPATSHSCSTTTLMTTSVIQRERVKTHL